MCIYCHYIIYYYYYYNYQSKEIRLGVIERRLELHLKTLELELKCVVTTFHS